MVEIFSNALPAGEIMEIWLEAHHNKNFGAFVTFIGIVREEDEIEALSFDIYKPLLLKWFDNWQEKASKLDAKILMAHSEGDVKVHQSSFACAVLSPKRRVALELIDEFVEDFKANAPIWKYDIKNGERIYAKERSHLINGSGLLA